MKRFLFFLLLPSMLLLSTGCSEESSLPIHGRWLMEGNAGQAMVKAVDQADSSIIIMSRAFDVKTDSVTGTLANHLVERARSGVTVSVLLPRNYLDFFDKMNRKAKERFEGTPVEVRLHQTRGHFGSDQEFDETKRGSEDDYISPAVLLVDGSVLFTGNYLMTPDNLTTDNNTTVQFRGPGIYNDVVPILSPVLDQHDLDTGMKRPPEIPQYELSDDWSAVRDFTFYLGRNDMDEILHELFATADTSVQISAWTVGNITSNPVRKVFEPLLSWNRRLNINEGELYYSDCSGKLCATNTWVDRQYQAYQYNEPDDQYQRFGLINEGRFYTGTYDLWAVSLWGSHYETLVTGYSEPMVERMNTWLEEHRNRADPKHEQWDRVSLRKKYEYTQETLNSTTYPSTEVEHFFHETLVPVVKNNQWDTLIRILDKKSAEGVAWDIYEKIKNNLKKDTGAPRSIVTQFEENYEIRNYRESKIHGKTFFRTLLSEVIRKDYYFEVIARNFVFDYLREVFWTIEPPHLVEHGKEYRLHQPSRTPLDGDFEWTIWLKKTSNEWELIMQSY